MMEQELAMHSEPDTLYTIGEILVKNNCIPQSCEFNILSLSHWGDWKKDNFGIEMWCIVDGSSMLIEFLTIDNNETYLWTRGDNKEMNSKSGQKIEDVSNVLLDIIDLWDIEEKFPESLA